MATATNVTELHNLQNAPPPSPPDNSVGYSPIPKARRDRLPLELSRVKAFPGKSRLPWGLISLSPQSLPVTQTLAVQRT